MSQHSRKSILVWLASLSPSESSLPAPQGEKRKRDPLADRLPNTMNSHPRRTPSPTKRRRPNEADLDEKSLEITPRPQRSIQSAGDDVSRQLSSSSTNSSAVSPRSRSPTKQMAEMLFAPQPIFFKQFGLHVPGELPAELITILHTLERRFSRGIAVVSDAYKVQ